VVVVTASGLLVMLDSSLEITEVVEAWIVAGMITAVDVVDTSSLVEVAMEAVIIVEEDTKTAEVVMEVVMEAVTIVEEVEEDGMVVGMVAGMVAEVVGMVAEVVAMFMYLLDHTRHWRSLAMHGVEVWPQMNWMLTSRSAEIS